MNITATATLNRITATASIGHTINAGGGDTTAPTFSVAPASASVTDTSFNITATLNEWGTVYSLVQPAVDAAPSVATIIATGESAIDTGSGVTISHTGLTGSTAYTAYVVAKDDDDNTQAAATEVDVTTDSGLDADAATWIAAGSFSAPQQTKINTFVLNCKTGLVNGGNIWAKFTALYGLTFADAANNAINGKNPGTFDLTFVNSPTHASTGVTFNGTTQYARTGVIPSSHISTSDGTLSVYLTNAQTSGSGWIMGSQVTSTSRLQYTANTSNLFQGKWSSNTNQLSVTNSVSFQGLSTFTRTSSTSLKGFMGATLVGEETGVQVGSLPNIELYIACYNLTGTAGAFISSNEFKVAMIGSGFTNNDVADWNAAVEAFIA